MSTYPTPDDVRREAASLEFRLKIDDESGTIDRHKISQPDSGGWFQDSQAGITEACSYLQQYRETIKKFDQAQAKRS